MFLFPICKYHLPVKEVSRYKLSYTGSLHWYWSIAFPVRKGVRAADEAIDRDFAAGRRPCNCGCMSPRLIATVVGRWSLPESTLVSSVNVDIPRIIWLCGSYESRSYSQRSGTLCRHVLRAH